MSISRRGFLGGSVAGAGLIAGSSAAEAAGGSRKFPGYADSNALLHDTTLCVGCRACEHACTKTNGLPKPKNGINDQTLFAKVRRITDKLYTVVNRHIKARGKKPAVYRKHQCMHCLEPCCANVCFVKAFSKTPEGPVLYDPDVCVGCRYCVMACPYNALAYEYDKPFDPKVVRCTMCYDLIKKGGSPSCAGACPMGAITYGKRADLIKLARSRIAKFPKRYVDHIYGEHDFGGSSWLTLSGVPMDKIGLPKNASHMPLPTLTSGFLSVVPLVITVYPGLLLGFYAWSKRRDRLADEAQVSASAEAKAAAEEVAKKKAEDQTKIAANRQKKAVDMAVKNALAEAEKKAAAVNAQTESEDGK
jgi:formate dehydrogenase iron-sulfur subunit